ncbi:hypothetical protein SDC9_159406 [bioreactor metagenome]|uniref:DUF3502 domain-containing protein n=1 Tax=bioreactor metagenome TaxID=1076179 RepID=A0A645FI06_9ZZZZ
MESEGYIVRTYITPTVTAKNCLTGLYGISAYSKLFDRSAEILTLLYCNADFKTVFTYGVENVNWIKNDDGTISKINDDYSMDFYQTGNTLIGYHTSDIPADYRDSAIQSNLIMKPDGFITFAGTFDEEQQDIIKQANEIVAGKYEELCQGVEDWEAQNNDILAKLDAIGFPDFLTNVFNAQYGPVATALSESEAARKAQKPPYLDDSANNGKTETGESNTEEVNTEEANTGEVEE